jgi:hypothetical protein
MKSIILSLASCVAMLAAPALATSAPLADYQYFVNKIKQAEDAFTADKPVEPALQDIKSTLPTFADAEQAKRERLARAIDDLLVRAKSASLILDDFWRLKAMVIDAKASTELKNLWRDAKARSATREQFEYVATLLGERADAAKEQPDLRQLVQDQIRKLMKEYLGGATLSEPAMVAFDDTAVRSLLDRAMSWLETMAVSRHATDEQLLYVKDLFTDRAKLLSADPGISALKKRVDAEIDRLISLNVGTAGFGREDLHKLRQMVMTKARAAVAVPTKD